MTRGSEGMHAVRYMKGSSQETRGEAGTVAEPGGGGRARGVKLYETGSDVYAADGVMSSALVTRGGPDRADNPEGASTDLCQGVPAPRLCPKRLTKAQRHCL